MAFDPTTRYSSLVADNDAAGDSTIELMDMSTHSASIVVQAHSGSSQGSDYDLDYQTDHDEHYEPSLGLSHRPSIDSNQDPGLDLTQDSGHHPGLGLTQAPSPNQRQEFSHHPSLDLSQTSSQDPSQDVGQETNQETNHDPSHDPSQDRIDPGRLLWRPFVLSWIVLSGFTVLFCLCIAALGVLIGLSASNDGVVAVPETSSTLRYVWTYLPTAFFTLIALAWGQVDYRAKQMMPWVSMRAGPQTTERSLLLDYVTPPSVVTLFQAGKARHWLAAAAVMGSLLLQIVTVLSTSLFASRTTMVTEPSPGGVMLTRFDAQSYKSGSNVTSESYYNVSHAGPWDLYFGISEFNLSLPSGTTDRYVYRQFRSINPKNLSVAAFVDVFSADLICEPARLVNMTVPDSVWTISSDQCKGIAFQPSMYQYSNNDVQVLVTTSNCKNEHSSNLQMRIGLLAGSFPSRLMNDLLPPTEYSEYTAVICEPTYQIQKAVLSYNSSAPDQVGPQISFVPSSTPFQLPDLSAWDIASPLPYTFVAKYVNKFQWWSSASAGSTMTFTSVLNASSPQSSASGFQNASMLTEAASAFYRLWTAQMAGLYLVDPFEEQLAFNFTRPESRLYTRGPSLWISEVALCALVFTSVFLLWQSQKAGMSRDPSSLGGLATVLAGSPDATRYLVHESMVDDRFIRKRLQSLTFELVLEPETSSAQILSFELGPIEHDADTITRSSKNSKTTLGHGVPKNHFYVPYVVSKPAMIGIALVPSLVIVVLEILYVYSHNHEGIAVVSDMYLLHYAWTLLPATLMTAISLVYGSLGSVVKSFQPFHAFQRGEASMHVGLMDNYQGVMAVEALGRALSKRQWATMAIALSSIAAPFLTIFVSGLYETRKVDGILFNQMRRADKFASNRTDASASLPWFDDANTIIDSANISFPGGTWENLVLHRTELPTLNNVDVRDGLKIRAILPSLRGNANCTAFQAQQILDTAYHPGNPHTDGIPTLGFEAIPPRPDCNISYSGNNPNHYIWPYSQDNLYFDEQFIGDSVPTPYTPYKGLWFDVESTYTLLQSSNYTTYHQEKPDCPRVFTYLAEVQQGKTLGLTAFYCSPYIEQLDVTVTYTLPDFQLDSENPPIPHENTTRPFADAMIVGMEHHFMPLNVTFNDTRVHNDYFYDVLLYGRDAVEDPSTLLGEANQDKLNAAINRLYGLIMATYLNTQRIPTDASDEAIFYNATLDAKQLKLFQDRISTRVLQSLLAFMVVCAITVFATMNTRHILPVNPNSIAGVASLLAGADMLDRNVVPEGAEWMSDAEMKAKGVFGGAFFSLGWFGEGEKRRFGIDIGQADKVDK